MAWRIPVDLEGDASMGIDEMRKRRFDRPQPSARAKQSQQAERASKARRTAGQLAEGGLEDDDEVEAMGEDMMMLCVSEARQGRFLEGTVCTTILVPRKHKLCWVAEKGGQLWAAKVEEAGEGHPYGPPHLTKAMAVLDYIADHLKVPDLQKEITHLKLLRDKLAVMALPEVCLFIRAFEVRGTYDKKDQPGFIPLDRFTFKIEGFTIEQENGILTPQHWHHSLYRVLSGIEKSVPKMGAHRRQSESERCERLSPF